MHVTDCHVTVGGEEKLHINNLLAILVVLVQWFFMVLFCDFGASALFLQWWTSGGVLLVGWLAHYLPYFLLSRVLFLHHYLPALPFKFMLLAAVCEHGFYWVSRSKWWVGIVWRDVKASSL